MLKKNLLKNKIKAFLFHFLLSIILVSLVLGTIVLVWYPSDYLSVTNFKGIALLVVSIDLVLGPILTFIAFNPEKKSLKLDLSFIVLIQFSALFYGVYTFYQAHPLFITFNHGAFNVVQANEVTPSNAELKEFKISKLSSPKLAYAQMPSDPEKQTEIITGVDLKGEPDIDRRAEYFEPYENHLDEILANSLDSTKLFNEQDLDEERGSFLKKHQNKIDKYAFLALVGISKDAILVLDKKTAEPITVINTVPWKYVKNKNM